MKNYVICYKLTNGDKTKIYIHTPTTFISKKEGINSSCLLQPHIFQLLGYFYTGPYIILLLKIIVKVSQVVLSLQRFCSDIYHSV